MALSWWNSSYPIRRSINIVNNGIDILAAGSPVYIELDFIALQNLKKVRDDFEDIEILYWSSAVNSASPNLGMGSTPIGEAPLGEGSFEDPSNWVLLARTAEYNATTGGLTIIFNTVEDIAVKDLDSYYIYMCNVTLRNQEVRPFYTSSEFSKIATPANDGIMFTKPTEEWTNGVSKEVNARAAFTFRGKNARFIFEYGPNRGIFELRVNNGSPILIDTFDDTTTNTVAYTATNLSVGKQYIRIRATGNKNPSSSSDVIKIVQVEYSNYVLATLDPEEISSTNDVTIAIVGL